MFLACPSGLQPYGICNDGVCAPGYQCIQLSNLCCPINRILPPPSIPAAPPILPSPLAFAQSYQSSPSCLFSFICTTLFVFLS